MIIRKSSNGKRLLFITTGSAAIASGVITAYAYYSPEFRAECEEKVPQTKLVFDALMGPLPKEVARKTAPVKRQHILEVIPPPLPPTLDKLPPIEKKAPVHVEPVDVRPPELIKKVTFTEEQLSKANAQLEESLLAAIAAAERRVQLATDAKMTTIQAVRNHANLLKKTVDDGQNANWDSVTAALQHAEQFARKDAGAEVDGRNYIDTLKKIVNDGRASGATRSNPLLLNALETANKLTHQLDELVVLVNRARQEASVFTEYKDLIERSRQQFALELKAILPNVDIHAKDKNLSEDELNALIAHAHLRVDQLRRQLAEQQLREEQNITRALESQKKADEDAATERLALEVRRLREQVTLDAEKEVVHSRSAWETETEAKLARATQAHSEHLEQVIRTQRQLFEIEHNQKVEEAVESERGLHSRHVGAALSRLEGIETALNSRVAMDAENRRSKQFWIACHHLIECIVHGERAGKDMETRRAPLAQQLDILKQVNGEDGFVQTLVDAFPDQSLKTGCYTHLDLKNRFDALYRSGRRTSMIDTNGGSVGKYLWSHVRSLFLLDLPNRFTYDDKIDVNSLDNLEILARAKYFVERDDFENAAKMLNLLEGEPGQLAKDWTRDARAHLETKFLAELLVAHAAVQSIRSTY